MRLEIQSQGRAIVEVARHRKSMQAGKVGRRTAELIRRLCLDTIEYLSEYHNFDTPVEPETLSDVGPPLDLEAVAGSETEWAMLRIARSIGVELVHESFSDLANAIIAEAKIENRRSLGPVKLGSLELKPTEPKPPTIHNVRSEIREVGGRMDQALEPHKKQIERLIGKPFAEMGLSEKIKTLNLLHAAIEGSGMACADLADQCDSDDNHFARQA